MVLRYYRWLPLELEPDYKDGYTCDHCHKDFLDAPFFHEEATGTDYCVDCGESAGYTTYTGLVGALLLSSSADILRDLESNAVVTFAYKVDQQTIGVSFANNSSMVLRLQMNGAIRDALSWSVRDNHVESKLRLTSADVTRRLPWLSSGLSKVFDLEISLHPLPAVPTPIDDVCIFSCNANDDYIRIVCADDYMQSFDVKQGREIVSKNSMVISTFSAGAPEECSKLVASAYLRDAVDALK